MITISLIEGLVESGKYNEAKNCLDSIKKQLTRKQYNLLAEGIFIQQMRQQYNKIVERERQIDNRFAEALRNAVKEYKGGIK